MMGEKSNRMTIRITDDQREFLTEIHNATNFPVNHIIGIMIGSLDDGNKRSQRACKRTWTFLIDSLKAERTVKD